MRGALALVILGISLPGMWRAGRLWQAERLAPVEAANLWPESSAKQLRVGRFDRALAINPRLARAWIGKGLDAEMAGDPATAERSLIEAARVSRSVLPAWTLANFHARRGDMDPFWTWARRSVVVLYSDPAPVFQLAWQLSDNAAEISDRLIASDQTARRYLRFLLESNRIEAAGPVAVRVAQAALTQDAALLFLACDRLIAASRVEDALEVWNRLGARGLHPYGKLDQDRPLTNGGFSRTPLGHGFDWILSPDPAVSVYTVSVYKTGSEAVVSFSGNQPESTDLLWQFVPLRSGSRFRLRFEYRTERLAFGPQWRFGNEELSDQPASESWRDAVLALEGKMGRLSLGARRRPGFARPAGTLYLRNVRLEPAL